VLHARGAAELRTTLRRFITFDQVTCLVSVVVIVTVHFTLHGSGYLLLLASMVGAAALLMGVGRRRVAEGRFEAGVVWVAVANWSVALGATAVATFCIPITVVASMLPSVLAVPYVRTRVLWRISAASMGVALVAVALGTVQDFSGLTAALPAWLPEAVLLAFVPFITGLVVLVSAHNSARLTFALDEALNANERLRASQAELLRSRARLAAATDAERRRIARDLHDGAQPRLLSLGLGLQRARDLMVVDPAAVGEALDRLASETREAWPRSATSSAASTRRCSPTGAWGKPSGSWRHGFP
jgi:signal transduction histidine kinase